MAGWLRRWHSDQDGFTAVEMIVTVAVGGLVMTAIFPLFLLLSRVEETWRSNAQARAIGLVAEESLARDLQSHFVVKAGQNLLVLQAGGNPGHALCISYSVDAGANPPRLVRTVSEPEAPAPISSSTVAHGVVAFEAARLAENAIRVSLQLRPAGDAGETLSVAPDPALVITPRVSSRLVAEKVAEKACQ